MSRTISFTATVTQDALPGDDTPLAQITLSFDSGGYARYSFLIDASGAVIEAEAHNIPAFAHFDYCYERAAQEIARAAHHHWQRPSSIT